MHLDSDISANTILLKVLILKAEMTILFRSTELRNFTSHPNGFLTQFPFGSQNYMHIHTRIFQNKGAQTYF